MAELVNVRYEKMIVVPRDDLFTNNGLNTFDALVWAAMANGYNWFAIMQEGKYTPTVTTLSNFLGLEFNYISTIMQRLEHKGLIENKGGYYVVYDYKKVLS
ncbi:cyclic nucleotide-binding domain-containing protein [Enterobacter pseudoroggenkampii]|uniref:hypothetical protein n=1 Tax=Enterobacter pseudoroggenkampii TaxID=2996112 RepID=UPI00226484CC|nr:hypothetical protein [Enterobacter pseudoroggenkampii]MCX8289097.1 hypothetical protein [Enterobacter pseudoroggenkampii]